MFDKISQTQVPQPVPASSVPSGGYPLSSWDIVLKIANESGPGAFLLVLLCALAILLYKYVIDPALEKYNVAQNLQHSMITDTKLAAIESKQAAHYSTEAAKEASHAAKESRDAAKEAKQAADSARIAAERARVSCVETGKCHGEPK